MGRQLAKQEREEEEGERVLRTFLSWDQSVPPQCPDIARSGIARGRNIIGSSEDEGQAELYFTDKILKLQPELE